MVLGPVRLAGRIFPCVHIYGVFHPACRDEILLLALAKCVHFSHATQLFSDFGDFLYLFARKRIALANMFDTFIQYQHKAR